MPNRSAKRFDPFRANFVPGHSFGAGEKSGHTDRCNPNADCRICRPVGYCGAAFPCLNVPCWPGLDFFFIGGSTLLTEVHTPAEWAKARAAHDFMVFATTAPGSFLSGQLLFNFGWEMVNLTLFRRRHLVDDLVRLHSPEPGESGAFA